MTNHSLCGVLTDSGRDCKVPVLSGTPFNVCREHMRAIAAYLMDARAAGGSGRLLRQPCPACRKTSTLLADWRTRLAECENCGHEMRGNDGEPYVQPVSIHRTDDVVYYARVGVTIKIGTTVNLRSRMSDYPPGSLLLASEPGSRELEKQRHLQFRADLAHGREWFHPSAALIEHINKLRETPLTAADLAA